MNPMVRPFPNLQGSTTPNELPRRIDNDIALVNYQDDSEVIDLPLPAEFGSPTMLSDTGGESVIELPDPGDGAVGESCADGNCSNGSCANGQCSTEGLNIQGAPGCAPYPPEYAHPGRHAALQSEKDTMKSMGIKKKHPCAHRGRMIRHLILVSITPAFHANFA